jgi:Zn-dependent M16 (insulinase) family peptidase
MISVPLCSAGSDPKRQEKFTVAWLTNKTTDPFENMSMNLLSRLLLNGPNAPMYKVLIDTNIGTPVRNRWCSSSHHGSRTALPQVSTMHRQPATTLAPERRRLPSG